MGTFCSSPSQEEKADVKNQAALRPKQVSAARPDPDQAGAMPTSEMQTPSNATKPALIEKPVKVNSFTLNDPIGVAQGID